MAILKNKDNTELFVDCRCGCDEGVRIKIDKEEPDCFVIMNYTNGNFYRDQESILNTISKKLKKIWAIIRNKDIYYSDIILTKEDFEVFKEYIDSIE